MKAVNVVSLWTSILGLGLTLALHLSSLCDLRPPFEEYVWALHILLFVVAIPAMWAVYVLRRHLKGWAYWKSAFTGKLTQVVLRGSPRWVQKFLTYLFAYAVVHMGIFFVRIASEPVRPEIVVGQTPLYVFVAGSAGWMFAYGVLGAIFYSALHVEDGLTIRTDK